MATVASLSLLLRADARPLQRDINRAQRTINRRFRQFNRQVDQQARRAVRGAAFAVAGIVAAATREFVQLERAQQRITALVGVSQEQLEAWGDDLQRIGSSIGRGPAELADALYDITSAGIQGEQAIQTLEAATKASAAGLGEVRQIADLATSAMNAYGAANVSSVDAVNSLIEAVRLGKLAPETLANAMGRVLPIASAMGVSLGEVSGAIAAMSRTGTTAEEAVTQLRSVMAQLLKPSVEAQQTYAQLGTDIAAVRDSVRGTGLIPTLLELRERLGGTNEAMVSLFPNIRALSGLFDLFGSGIEGNLQIIDEMADSAGVLDDAYRQVEGSFSHFVSRLASLGQFLLAELGERVIRALTARFGDLDEAIVAFAQAGDRISDTIVFLVERFVDLVGWVYDNRRAILALLAAYAGFRVLTGITGLMANMATALGIHTAAAGSATVATRALAVSLGALRFGLWTAGVVAATTAVVKMVEAMRGLNQQFQDAREHLQQGGFERLANLSIPRPRGLPAPGFAAEFEASLRPLQEVEVTVKRIGEEFEALGETVAQMRAEFQALEEVDVGSLPGRVRREVDQDRFLRENVAIGDLSDADARRLSGRNQIPEIEVTAQAIGQQIADGITKDDGVFANLGETLQRTLSLNFGSAIARGDWSSLGSLVFQSVTQALLEPFLNKGISALFGGLLSFHDGVERGPVPGAQGATRTANVQAGEWVFTPRQIQNFARNVAASGVGGGVAVEANFTGNIDPMVQRSNRRHIYTLAEQVAAVLQERRALG